jgi:hypothetical protein
LQWGQASISRGCSAKIKARRWNLKTNAAFFAESSANADETFTLKTGLEGETGPVIV